MKDRSHLVQKFEKANLDEYIEKDPDDRAYVKKVNSYVGKGLIAKRDIVKGELIAFYRGHEISRKQFDDLARNNIEYVFFNERWGICINAKDSETLAKYMNDSERPNCVAKPHKDKKRVTAH